MSKYDYYVLDDIIGNIGTTQYELKATNLEKNETDTLANWDYISDYLITKYGDRSIFLTVDAPTNNFLFKFFNYIATRQHNIDMLYTSFMTYYNPVENYNRYETSELTKNGKELRAIGTTGTDTQSTDYGKNETTNTYGAIISNTLNGATNQTTESKISADNSDNYQPDNMTTTSMQPININTTTDGRTDTTIIKQKTDTNTTTYGKKINDSLEYINRADSTESHIHGNIGVTTGAQMIQGELSVRLVDLVNLILDEFAKLYTIYL